jgi:nucleoside-diphosphate-sugar epimerase
MSKRVLITGVAGMIGSHLADECLARGWTVTGIDDLRSGRREYVPAGVRLLYNSILVECLPPDSYDYVFHLAAEPFIPASYKRPDRFVETNVLGTVALIGSLQDRCEKLVNVSSSEVYGTAQRRPMTEDHPLNPQSIYAMTKLAAEQAGRILAVERGIPVITFRPFNTFGPRCTQPYLIPEIMRQVAAGEGPIRLGNLAAGRDFTWVGEMAWVLAETAVHGTVGETYHWGQGVTRTVSEIAHDVARARGQNRLLIGNTTNRMRPNDVEWLEADRSKLEAVIGQPPWPLRTEWMTHLICMWAWYERLNMTWPWETKGEYDADAE